MTRDEKPKKTFEEAITAAIEGVFSEGWDTAQSGATPSWSLKYRDAIRQAAISYGNERVREALDAVEQSIKQHTVPEGRDLITRSYVRNTLAALRPKPEEGETTPSSL